MQNKICGLPQISWKNFSNTYSIRYKSAQYALVEKYLQFSSRAEKRNGRRCSGGVRPSQTPSGSVCAFLPKSHTILSISQKSKCSQNVSNLIFLAIWGRICPEKKPDWQDCIFYDFSRFRREMRGYLITDKLDLLRWSTMPKSSLTGGGSNLKWGALSGDCARLTRSYNMC